MKKKGRTTRILLTLVVLSLIVLSGCLQDTLSRNQEPQDEQEQIDAEEERQRQEEEKNLEEERQREERVAREAALREQLGAFFVPLPPVDGRDNPAVKAKGIYVTGHMVASKNRFEELVTLIEATELNTMVIDVKNDHGLMTYRSEIEIINEMNANKGAIIKDMDAVLTELNEREIYPIARVVVFRDPHLPEMKKEWAIQKRNGGGQWRDPSNFAWVNPYEKNVWDYNIAIAKEAAIKGFREIQFDYVRFPENAKRVDREAEFPGANGRAKDEAIEGFLAYAQEQLKEYNVHVSADVFGVIATSKGDADGIGQNWEKVSPQVDIICPMIYPSHYGPGYFGFSVPDANPAGTINRALVDAIKRNATLETPAVIRPWLQSFTASWVKGNIVYGPAEVRAQIDAALDLGIDEFLIWNAANRYSSGSFLTPSEAKTRAAAGAAQRLAKSHDVLGRTAETALVSYLDAVKTKNWRDVYLWQVRDFVVSETEFKAWVESWTSSLQAYTSIATEQDGRFTVDMELKVNDEIVTMVAEHFTIVMENNVWKVDPPQSFVDIISKKEVSSGSTEEASNNN
ncbi:MAG: putative glycoside hydrolase [Firmicutes bacterium]|nr:putative glycoside hydrolase [Bacillota bacterium]